MYECINGRLLLFKSLALIVQACVCVLLYMLRTCVNSVVLLHVYELSLQACPIPLWRINNFKIAILVLDNYVCVCKCVFSLCFTAIPRAL